MECTHQQYLFKHKTLKDDDSQNKNM